MTPDTRKELITTISYSQGCGDPYYWASVGNSRFEEFAKIADRILEKFQVHKK